METQKWNQRALFVKNSYYPNWDFLLQHFGEKSNKAAFQSLSNLAKILQLGG